MTPHGVGRRDRGAGGNTSDRLGQSGLAISGDDLTTAEWRSADQARPGAEYYGHRETACENASCGKRAAPARRKLRDPEDGGGDEEGDHRSYRVIPRVR